jgi:flagellar protein FlaI
MSNLPIKMKECSQECGAECGINITNCPVYAELTPELQEQCQTKLHLLQYLHSLPLDEIGMPQYYPKLNRSIKNIKNRNLI